MDVLEHLTQEHRQVEDLLQQLSEADEGQRPAIIDELERSLALHMAVEERHLYPIVEQVIDQETEDEAETEHDLAREGIAKLRAMADQPGFGAVVDMVAAGIKHHVEEEEGEIFPELRKKAADELAALDPEALEAEVAADGAPRGGRRAANGTANGAAKGGSRPAAGADDEATRDELYEQAKEADIPGRSSMSKDELRRALAKQG